MGLRLGSLERGSRPLRALTLSFLAIHGLHTTLLLKELLAPVGRISRQWLPALPTMDSILRD